MEKKHGDSMLEEIEQEGIGTLRGWGKCMNMYLEEIEWESIGKLW